MFCQSLVQKLAVKAACRHDTATSRRSRCAKDHLRPGQDEADQPEEPDVVMHLVDDAGGTRGCQAQPAGRCTGEPRFRPRLGSGSRGPRSAWPAGGRPPGQASENMVQVVQLAAPQTAGCEARICSRRLVPERGRPTTKTGRAVGVARVSGVVERSGREGRDHSVDEPRLIVGVVNLASRGPPGRLESRGPCRRVQRLARRVRVHRGRSPG